MMKDCVQVLKVLRKCPGYTFRFTATQQLPPDLRMDPDTFRLVVEHLVAHGYVTGHDTSCSLTLSGLHYRRTSLKRVFMYVADHWIDFFALVTAIIALILSLV